jgi:hypothetical protein
MLNTEALDDLRTRLLGGETLLFLQTHEEARWEKRLDELARELERPLVKWSSTADHADSPGDPIAFLKSMEKYADGTIFLIKDPHPFYGSPAWIRRVRELAESMKHKHQAMLMLGPDGTVPFDLEKQAHAIRLPLPGLEELMQELNLVLQELRAQEIPLDPPPEEQERLAKTVLGLTADEARRAFRYSLLTQREINDGLYALLISEKRQMVQGSDLLEFYDLEDGKAAIGGLEALKEWIDQRADAFSTAAQEQGIPTPKGVFLLGVQGCGKSLTARVAATMLRFPLIRLDTAALLASGRGASEKNLREVLKLVETIAPAVLWIDEIEKGFGGFDTESDDATMSRIVGAFLTWMEEHKPPVFVVATANSIERLPPEMLRRGRFDELFFVDLPNFEERKSILRVHLGKRGWNPDKFDLDRLSDDCDTFSGAEIEQIVASALLEAYAKNRILTEEDIIAQRELTVPLSQTKEDEIFKLREWARVRCRPATPDSRVAQMLESEHRSGNLKGDGPSEDLLNRWKELADHGQLNAAVIEYIRPRTAVSVQQLRQDLGEFIPTEGELGLALRAEPNAVIYSGLSQELCELLAELVKRKRLFLHPARPDFFDQNSLPFELPVLEALGTEKVPRPVWLPVSLRVSPPVSPDERMMRIARVRLNRPKSSARTEPAS